MIFFFTTGDGVGAYTGSVGEVVESIRESNREQMEQMNRIMEQQARQSQQVISTLSTMVTQMGEKKMELSDDALDKLADAVAAKVGTSGGAVRDTIAGDAA